MVCSRKGGWEIVPKICGVVGFKNRWELGLVGGGRWNLINGGGWGVALKKQVGV